MAPKNKMQDLRNHLFETLEALKDDDKPMDVERAKAISSVAAQIIESAKVEVKFLEVTGVEHDGAFFGEAMEPDRSLVAKKGNYLGTGEKIF